MTLIVAIGCTDGVVLAADSASSDSESGAKLPVEKISRIGAIPIVYGGSGDVGLLQNIRDSLRGYQPKNTLKNIRHELRKLVIEDLKNAKQMHVPYPHPAYHEPPSATLLFAGVQDKTPWIVEIAQDGRDTAYGKDMGSFAAIGSGKPWAQAVFSPHVRTDRDVRLGKIFAYRVMEDSINLAAAYLSKPIVIYTVDVTGQVVKLGDPDIAALADTAETWRSLERETVGSLLSGQTTTEPDLPPPPST